MISDSVKQRLKFLAPGKIDFHTHAIDPDLADIGRRYDGVFPQVVRVSADTLRIFVNGKLYRELDRRSWHVPSRIADMDAEGVGVQVLSPIPITLCHNQPPAGARALARAQNDFLAGMVAAAPDRFLALGAVPLQDPDEAIRELERGMGDLGFAGCEIGTLVGDLELSDRTFTPFFERAASLGAVVFVHPVDQTVGERLRRLGLGFGLGMPTETATAAAALLHSGILRDLPGLRLCLAHAGGSLPSLLPRLSNGQRRARGSSYEVSASFGVLARSLWADSLTYDPASLSLAAERFGANHLVLGTDYPFAAREAPAGAVLEAAAARIGGAQGIGRDNALDLISPPGTA